MKQIKAYYTIVLLSLCSFKTSAFYVTPDIVECIRDSKIIVAATVVSFDSMTVTVNVSQWAKGKSAATLTIEKYWQPSCIGGGHYHDYEKGDQFVFFIHKPDGGKLFYPMDQEEIFNDSIHEYTSIAPEHGYDILLSQYLGAIRDFEKVFELKKGMTKVDEIYTESELAHILVPRSQELFQDYISRSQFHKDVAQTAGEYVDERSFFSPGKKKRARF